jgi:excinuclease ABC subunit A
MYKVEIPVNDLDVKKNIYVQGARVHNLKNLNIILPKNNLIVFTGLSGSGKSSLAFDTLYAEGQRRYVESLSSYSRQFLDRMEKPDVDRILGISPAIAIEQKNTIRNPRSTVGTTTEIYDYLKLLFARIGKTICPKCGRIVKKDNVKSVLDRLSELQDNSKIYILIPLKRIPGVPFSEKIKFLKESGFFRLVWNNQVYDLTENPEMTKKADDKYVLVDRLIFRKSSLDNRFADSIEMAFRNGKGNIIIRNLETKEDYRFSDKFECSNCDIQYEEPDLHFFSFNNPRGACRSCQGFGQFITFDLNLVVPDPKKSLKDGAITIWNNIRFSRYQSDLIIMCREHGIDIDKPFSELTKTELKKVILGEKHFSGIKHFFEEIEKRLFVPEYSKVYYKYRGVTVCPDCEGSRVRGDALNVFVAGKNIKDIINMDIANASEFFRNINLSKIDIDISHRILQEVKRRLQYLLDVGLEYLTLNRSSYSLSGGEAQRISLASSLGAGLVGSMYILDEPSIGLHPRDNFRLIKILKSLRDVGNTVIVVEHDPDMMKSADYIVDIGPKSGENGGEIIYYGTFKNITKDENSLTGKYLKGNLKIEIPETRRIAKNHLEIIGARENNLKNINVKIPLNVFVCVTGVSGSGKSSLILDVLYYAFKRYEKMSVSTKHKISDAVFESGNLNELKGISNIDSIELVDQTPIGKSTRSNPATYIKAYDIIREIFAQTAQSKVRGYTASHFSFNQPEGRCDLCEGEGYQTIEMQFMADIKLPCESCQGKRFKNDILEVNYKGKNIDDVLNLTITEAAVFFEGTKRLVKKLKILEDVGLGYLRLGQSSSTFSGGEAQRIKLASHLDVSDLNGHTLFIFDEPTTGLHFDDIKKLIKCFNSLIEAGNSVLIIEHNMDLIKTADYIIDLGPEGGAKGGELIFSGTPEEIMKCEKSYTGKILKSYLD